MTAAELHALVQHWPEEARAKGLEWDDELASWIAMLPAAFVSDDHAIALHVASATVWWINRLPRGEYLCWQKCNVGVRLVRYDNLNDEWEELGSGRTEIHAISAAITATRGGG